MSCVWYMYYIHIKKWKRGKQQEKNLQTIWKLFGLVKSNESCHTLERSPTELNKWAAEAQCWQMQSKVCWKENFEWFTLLPGFQRNCFRLGKRAAQFCGLINKNLCSVNNCAQQESKQERRMHKEWDVRCHKRSYNAIIWTRSSSSWGILQAAPFLPPQIGYCMIQADSENRHEKTSPEKTEKADR